MGPNSKLRKIDPVEMGIETTVMAIREKLMEYFKGTCIERFTARGNISMESIGGDNRFYYERRQAENERSCMIFVGNAPILTVKHSPERIVFHTAVLQRSPQMRKVQEGVEKFMTQFLTGVEKEYNDAYVTRR